MKYSRGKFFKHSLAAAALSGWPLHILADDIAARFRYTLDDILNNLVTVHATSSGKKKNYCGCVVLMEGKPYLVTNQHFILGSERLSFSSPGGRKIKPRSVELSVSSDIVRLALDEGSGFELAEHPSMGDSIAVFGSDQSKDSKQSIYGKINGIGADMIEVSAEFEEANCGTPVLTQDQEVVGIASYARESGYHIMKKGTRFENRTRQFCNRLSDIQWKMVNWKRFNQTFGHPYHETNVMIEDVITILNSWAEEPLKSVDFEGTPDKTLTGWIESHNTIVSKAVDTGKGRREFYANYSESAEKLSTLCKIQARKIRVLEEQRGLTGFIADELNMQASTLEMAAKTIERYGASTY